MTDVDSMHRHVQNLLRFEKDAKEAIEFFKVLKAGSGSMAVPDGAKAPDAALEERLTAIEGVGADNGRDLATFEERLAALELGAKTGSTADETDAVADLRRDLTTLDDRVDRLEAFKGDVVPVLDELGSVGGLTALSGLAGMVAWFSENKEALELMLSIGDDEPEQGSDTPGKVDGPVTASGTVVAGPGNASGADSAAPGADGAAPGAAPAASANPAEQFPQADGSMGTTRGT